MNRFRVRVKYCNSNNHNSNYNNIKALIPLKRVHHMSQDFDLQLFTWIFCLHSFLSQVLVCYMLLASYKATNDIVPSALHPSIPSHIWSPLISPAISLISAFHYSSHCIFRQCLTFPINFNQFSLILPSMCTIPTLIRIFSPGILSLIVLIYPHASVATCVSLLLNIIFHKNPTFRHM